MIEYIKGTLEDLTPTDAVVECHGIGYKLLISLQTFSQLENKREVTVYIIISGKMKNFSTDSGQKTSANFSDFS